jgi:coenzyme F420-reducing hydrogenase delta subunit
LVIGCQPGECHYQKGNLLVRRRIVEMKPLLDALGIGSERLGLEWIPTSQRGRVERAVEEFTEAIEQLDSSPFNSRPVKLASPSTT